MTQLGAAVARYNKLIETSPYKDLAWADELREQMQAKHLTVGGRPICPVLRPHFITRRQYKNLVKAAEALFGALDRIKHLALANPALLSRMELLPAEKMLASVDPGYQYPAVTSLLDTHIENGHLQFVECNSDTASGVVYGEMLSELFYDALPVKEFRKRHTLTKLGGMKYFLQALLKAYKQFGGKKSPQIGILEFRQPFQTVDSGEYLLLREYFEGEGYPTQVIYPDQLEYRAGVLKQGDFQIDLIYRRVRAQEFLIRFDLTHPLVRAYREHAVCMVNSFRSELSHKKAIFDLLTDDNVTAGFPAAERKAIRDYIPWTRLVSATKTSYNDKTVDLIDFILQNREKLVLKPNDDSGEQHTVHGSETDDAGWERALKAAMRNPYVVQERVAPASAMFPVLQWGALEIRELKVDVHPHSYLGKVQGCSSWVTADGPAGFSSISGLAPTFILESR